MSNSSPERRTFMRTDVRERSARKLKSLGDIALESAPSLWKGKISTEAAAKRLGKDGKEQVEEAIEAIGSYYAPVDAGAPTQCIDGRHCTEHRHPLGAKVPGGTAGVAFADALVRADALPEGSSFAEDLAVLVRAYRSRGFSVGDHIDDHTHANGIGCGAVDKMPDSLAKMQEPAFARHIKTYLQAILGTDYDVRTADLILARAKKLGQRSGTYFDKEYAVKAKKALETAGAGAVETLTGDHHEIALVINHVPGTTFDRDAFSDATGGSLQAFDYDFWSVRLDAQRLYPDDTRKQREFLTASAMAAVATMMLLSDGTTRLLARH